MQKIVGSFTGHRPDKAEMFNEKYSEEQLKNWYNHTRRFLEPLSDNYSRFYTGAALGFDTVAALACYSLKIPYIAAVPFKGQEKSWKDKRTLDRYFKLLENAESIVYVDDLNPNNVLGYSAAKMQTRNKYMVDNSDEVVAFFDGTSGGTSNCVTYAKSVGKSVLNCYPTR